LAMAFWMVPAVSCAQASDVRGKVTFAGSLLCAWKFC